MFHLFGIEIWISKLMEIKVLEKNSNGAKNAIVRMIRFNVRE